MCLFPKKIKNPGYDSFSDCLHRSPFSDVSCVPPDYELFVPCGKCWQCRQQFRNEIVLRLKVELATIPYNTRAYFVTLTFDNRALYNHRSNYRVPVLRYLDVLRKRYGYFRYYFISELGDENGRFHYHGILYGLPDIPYNVLTKCWPHGRSWYGWVTERTCGYITKYITKQQFDTKLEYAPVYIRTKTLGCGFENRGLFYVRRYLTFFDKQQCFDGSLPNCVALPDGYTYSVPRYYRDKLFSKTEVLESRYIGYSLGPRFRYMGFSYSSEDAWRRAIARSRMFYSPDKCRLRDQKRFVPRRCIPRLQKDIILHDLMAEYGLTGFEVPPSDPPDMTYPEWPIDVSFDPPPF